jgi:hypothetical protein
MSSQLEKLYALYKGKIPDVDRGHLSYDFRKNQQANLDDKGNSEDFEKRSKQIEEQLKLLGLNPIAVNIIMDYFVSNMSYEDIANRYKFKDRHVARRIIETLTQSLKTSKTFKRMLTTLRKGVLND